MARTLIHKEERHASSRQREQQRHGKTEKNGEWQAAEVRNHRRGKSSAPLYVWVLFFSL